MVIGTWVSVLPPIIATVMVLATRRVCYRLIGYCRCGSFNASFSPVSTL